MTPIFDRFGHHVSWLDNANIHDVEGIPKAFIVGPSFFSYGAKYLGYFMDGYFRDSDGNAISFIEGAHNGPLLPRIAPPPHTPVPAVPPRLPIPPLPFMPPTSTLSWSNLDWLTLLND